MKINSSAKEMKLSDLAWGRVFVYENEIYIRAHNGADPDGLIAVELETGRIQFFSENVWVFPKLNANLTLE